MRSRVLRSAFCFPALAAAFFSFADPAFAEAGTAVNTALDRIADAVDGAESSHGSDLSMWRPNPAGPQGPMQVSERAAVDVGGGDRFDIAQNRALGRAYLRLLYRRYGNWADAVFRLQLGNRQSRPLDRSGAPIRKAGSCRRCIFTPSPARQRSVPARKLPNTNGSDQQKGPSVHR
jgi:hypothetical protein